MKLYKNYELPLAVNGSKETAVVCEENNGGQGNSIAGQFQVEGEQWPSGNKLVIGAKKEVFLKPKYLTILTYNVWFQENNTHNRYPVLLKMIHQAKADIVCLQEVCPKFLKALKQSLKTLEKGKQYYLSITQMHWYDTVILSRYPCRFYKKPFTNSEMERSALIAVIQFSQSNNEQHFKLAINCVHLQSSQSPIHRIEQINEIKLLNREMDFTVIAGDFNFSDKGQENGTIEEYCDVWKTGKRYFSKWATEEMKQTGFTMPATPHSPAVRLDHIIFKIKNNQQLLVKDNNIAIIGDFTIPPYEQAHFSKVSEDFYVRTPSDHFGLLASIHIQ